MAVRIVHRERAEDVEAWFDTGRRGRWPGSPRTGRWAGVRAEEAGLKPASTQEAGGSTRVAVRGVPAPFGRLRTGSGPAHHERGVGWGCGSTRAAEGLWSGPVRQAQGRLFGRLRTGSPRTDWGRRAGRRRRLYGRWDRGRRDDGSARYSIRAERPTTSRIRSSVSCPLASVRRSSSPRVKWTGWGWPWLIAMLLA